MRKGKAVDDALKMRLASSPVKRLGTTHQLMTQLNFGHVFLDFAVQNWGQRLDLRGYKAARLEGPFLCKRLLNPPVSTMDSIF